MSFKCILGHLLLVLLTEMRGNPRGKESVCLGKEQLGPAFKCIPSGHSIIHMFGWCLPIVH